MMGGETMSSVNWRLCAVRSFRLVNQIVAPWLPAGRLAAAELRLTNKVAAGPAAGSVPFVAEIFNQAEVFTSAHASGTGPALVKAYACALGTNGPPTGPLLATGAGGVICRASGGAIRAEMRRPP